MEIEQLRQELSTPTDGTYTPKADVACQTIQQDEPEKRRGRGKWGFVLMFLMVFLGLVVGGKKWVDGEIGLPMIYTESARESVTSILTKEPVVPKDVLIPGGRGIGLGEYVHSCEEDWCEDPMYLQMQMDGNLGMSSYGSMDGWM